MQGNKLIAIPLRCELGCFRGNCRLLFEVKHRRSQTCAPAFHLSLQHINLNYAVQVVLRILNVALVNFVISS